VRSETQTLAISPGVVAKVYDAQMPSFSADGAWNPKAIEVIRNSLKELGFCRRCRPRRIFITTSSCR